MQIKLNCGTYFTEQDYHLFNYLIIQHFFINRGYLKPVIYTLTEDKGR